MSHIFSKQLASSQFCVLPVAYGVGGSLRVGMEWGPQQLLKGFSCVEAYDIETDSEPSSRGIYSHPIAHKSHPSEEMVQWVKSETAKAIKRKKTAITVGGSHAVSIGAIRAHADSYDNLSVLHVGAHASLRDNHCNDDFNRFCVMARTREVVPKERIVQVGVRSMSKEEAEVAGEHCYDVYKIMRKIMGWNKVIEMACNVLTDQVYITFDLSAFDPSVMPDVGTPQPGGISWFQAIQLLLGVFSHKNIVGFDVVEFCPPILLASNTDDNVSTSSIVAAKLLYKMIAYKAKQLEISSNGPSSS